MKHDDEDKKKVLPLNRDADHPLRTRRDFLAQGLLTGVGSLILPFGAYAADSCDLTLTATDNPMIPVIVIDLAGGSNIAGSNVIVGKKGGQTDFLSDYTTLGLDSTRHPSLSGMINNELGIGFHRDSGILAGIKATTTAATRSKVDGILFCAVSSDDTDNNPHNPMYWFHKAGARGAVTQLIGNVNSLSGARSQAPAVSVDVSVRPTRVQTPNDVTNMIGIGTRAEGFMGMDLDGKSRGRMLMQAIDALSESHIRSISRRKMSDKIKDIVLCNSAKTQGVLSKFTTNDVNPASDNMITSNFNVVNGGDQRTAGTVTKMVLDGLAATGTITMGGFDYHTGNRTTGDQKDREVGEIIGRIMQTAAMKGKPVVVYVYTDGGVAARNQADNNAQGKLVWGGDSSQRSASLMLVYNPSGRPTPRIPGRQIGAYKEGGSVDTNANPISNSVVNLAKAVVLNYMALHGQEGEFENVVDSNPFTSLDPYIIFSRIA